MIYMNWYGSWTTSEMEPKEVEQGKLSNEIGYRGFNIAR